MLERVGIAVLVFAGLLAFVGWLKRRQRAPRFADMAAGAVCVVSFSTRRCGQCRAQKSVLERAVEDSEGTLRLVNIDAEEDPAMARAWRVMTVPTSFVLDPAGQVIAVNNGFVNDAQLRRQLGEARLQAG